MTRNLGVTLLATFGAAQSPGPPISRRRLPLRRMTFRELGIQWGIDEFGYRGGGQVFGAGAMPSDGDPKHEPPYSAEGLKAYHANKPEFGVTAVPRGENK